MKKMFVLSMLISLTMICSCQKQDSVAEAQLAQRKTELDAREKGLDERENAVAEREKAVAAREKALSAREKAAASVQSPTDAQSRGAIPDAAQLNPERDKRIQQLPPEVRALALIPDRSQVTAGDPAKQERPAPRQLRPEDLQRQWQSKMDKEKMSGEAAFPAAQAGSPTPSPAVEVASPSPSPTPE